MYVLLQQKEKKAHKGADQETVIPPQPPTSENFAIHSETQENSGDTTENPDAEEEPWSDVVVSTSVGLGRSEMGDHDGGK